MRLNFIVFVLFVVFSVAIAKKKEKYKYREDLAPDAKLRIGVKVMCLNFAAARDYLYI